MKIPKKLKRAIGPHDIRVVKVPHLMAERNVWGESHSVNMEIHQDPGLRPQRVTENFWHEIIEFLNGEHELKLEHPTIDTLSSMRASLVHDALYQLIRMRRLMPWHRGAGDKLFYQVCIEDGMWKARAWVWYKAVSNFAGWAAKPGSQEEDKIICVGKEEE